MKNKIITLFTLILLTISSAYCVESVATEPASPMGAAGTTVQSNDVAQEYVDETTEEPYETITTKPMAGNIVEKSAKSPYANDLKDTVARPSGEFSSMIIKFLKVMFAVAVCSVLIYLILLFVRKFYGENLVNNAISNELEDNLKPSQNENDALKVFLNKTKKQ